MFPVAHSKSPILGRAVVRQNADFAHEDIIFEGPVREFRYPAHGISI